MRWVILCQALDVDWFFWTAPAIDVYSDSTTVPKYNVAEKNTIYDIIVGLGLRLVRLGGDPKIIDRSELHSPQSKIDVDEARVDWSIL